MMIRRSWIMTLTWMLGAAIGLGLTGLLVYSGYYIYATLLAFLSLLAIFGAGSGSYATDCPVCGARLRGLAGLTRCPECLSYGKVTHGEYRELEPGFISPTPALAAPLHEGNEIPPLCCACGTPATRTERLRIIRLEFAFDLDAPHCQRHTGGADLDAESFGGGKGGTLRPVLKVMSYTCYRALVKTNYPEKARW